MKKSSFDEREFPFSIPPADGTEILSAKVDFTFKKLFGCEENKEILIAFLQTILSIPKEDYDDIIFDNPILEKDFAFSKYGVLDVLLKLKNGTKINIEMQLVPKINYASRIVYYISNLINTQTKRGKDYITIPKTISISILNFKLIHDNINYKHIFHLYDEKNNIKLTDLIEIITIELPKIPLQDNEDQALPWLRFIEADGKENIMTIVEKYPHLKEAYTKLQELSLNEDAITEYNLRLRAFYDETTMLNEMERRKIALEDMENKMNAYQVEFEDTAQKLEKTSTELEKKTEELENIKIETAKRLLSMGDSPEKISKVTGLSEEEVKNLSAKNGFKAEKPKTENSSSI